MTDEQKRLRREHANRIGRGYYLDKLPSKCCNCGAADNLVYHHIVPISQGGTNNITNIAVVCARCHKAIHNEKEIRAYNLKSGSGRPAKVSEEVSNKAFEEYIYCRIGQKELKEILQLSSNSKIADYGRYKRYLTNQGIRRARNNIDIINANGAMRSGREVGWIEFTSGERKTLYAQD